MEAIVEEIVCPEDLKVKYYRALTYSIGHLDGIIIFAFLLTY